jgi:hypothetical protein
MRDYSGLYQEFANYANLVNAQGRTPTESDIDFFVEKFLTAEYGFPFGQGAYISSAQRVDRDTGEVVFDTKGDAYSKLEKEIKPLLVSKVEELYAELGDTEQAFVWDAEPIGIDELATRNALNMGLTTVSWNNLKGTARRSHEATIKAGAELAKVKSRIKEFNEKAIPFILRQTMNHPIQAGVYSTTSGTGKVVRTDENGDPFIISNEKELQKYLSSSTIRGFPAAQDQQLRYLWFVPSPTGKSVKIAIIDVDNPANLPDKTVRKGVEFISKKLEDNGHPNLIMFTGSSYQVWFSRNEFQPLGDIADARTLVISLMYNPEMFEIGDGKARTKAIDKKLLWLDTTGFAAGKANRMFFNLHYPSEKSQKKFSGLVSIPVGQADIASRFDPISNAHPEAVLKNFDRYASIVSQFFDMAQVGQDYEVEAAPPCLRTEERDPEHKLLNNLLENNEVINVPSSDIGSMLEDEEDVVCYVKERGVSAVLHYDSIATIRVGGKALSTKSIKKSGGISLKVDKVKAVLVLANGTVIYDDFICRDVQRYCEAKGISKLTLVGSVVKRDPFGNNQGAQSVRSILERKEGISPFEARQLNFAPYKLVTFDKSAANLPIAKQLEELKKIQTSRISPTIYVPIKGTVGLNVARLFRDLLVQRKVGSLVVVGEETYLITSRRTIKATIVGLDKQSNAYKSGGVPPMFVAVTKKHSKLGPIYIIIGKAQLSLPREERKELLEMVRGEQKEYEDREGNTIKSFSNVIPLKARVDIYAEEIEVVEPSVVVEVQYDDVSPIMTPALPHTFKVDAGGRKFRAATGKKLWTTGLIGPRITAITALSPIRVADIDIGQDVLLDVTGKRPPKGMSILDTLPNPRKENIRRNGAFFGVPTTRRIGIGGKYVDNFYDKKTRTWMSGVTGGKQAQIDLTSTRGGLPGEFEKAAMRAKKGEPGFQAFVDETAKTTSGSAVPYYTITSLGSMYQDAVDDVYGVGGPFGSSVITMDGGLEFGTTQMPFGEQLESRRVANREQGLEDRKILAAQIGKVPTSRDPELRGGDIEDQVVQWGKSDQGYASANKLFEEELKKALSKNKISEKQFVDLLEANDILSNPVIKSTDWTNRVNEYAKEFERWKDSPDPKDSWEDLAQGKFGSWEIPILEKERLMGEAELKYALSEDDMGAINSRFGAPMSGELLESVLSDLYEEEGEDDESAFETDSE